MTRKPSDFQLAEAARRRADMIAILSACTCAHPVIVDPDPSGHPTICPSYILWRQMREAAKGAAPSHNHITRGFRPIGACPGCDHSRRLSGALP